MDIEMGNLHERVHARVCATRALALELPLTRYRAHCAFQFALDRPGVLLFLPAAIAGAGIFENYFESRHNRS